MGQKAPERHFVRQSDFSRPLSADGRWARAEDLEAGQLVLASGSLGGCDPVRSSTARRVTPVLPARVYDVLLEGGGDQLIGEIGLVTRANPGTPSTGEPAATLGAR